MSIGEGKDMQIIPVENEIKRLSDLADENRSYNLVEAYQQRIALEELDRIIKRFNEMRSKIANQYARTIGEYLEAGITQTDGIIIKVVKEGRASLNEEKARELYPEECKHVETVTKIIDLVKLKAENPDLVKKYEQDSTSITLTDLRKGTELTKDQLEKVITRGPATYEVEVLQKDPANIPLIEE